MKWMFLYWASSSGCGPRMRKRSRLAAQRRPHRNSMECWHGDSSRGKQKKQRTGTSSSNSVITGSRRPAGRPSRCFGPCRREKLIAVCRGIPSGSTSPLATDASGEQPCLNPSVGCRSQSQCSPQRGRMPLAILLQ
ncbi:hypothetical protein TcCL_NonESM08287 [Trypanosoma cruzi]|nr:hypothetical protein TcCL_NonESM08287 [Trypanosoma cruzi]